MHTDLHNSNNNKGVEKNHLVRLESISLKMYFCLSPCIKNENKTGELMSPVKVKKQKLTGKQWKEENLEKDFPEIWKIFN